MRPRQLLFPVIMCVMTVATAAALSRQVERRREYNFVVRADFDGVSRLKDSLADADFNAVEDVRLGDGLYRITVRCPPERVWLMWSIMEKRGEK